MNFDNTRVRVDLDAIERNFQAIREKAGVAVMAVIKADAYGHGAVPIARLLEGKCAYFGVSSMLEALELRRSGIRTPILVLGHTPVQAFPTAILENIRPTIYRYEDAVALSEAAQLLGITAPFHIAVDTGMSRIGFQVTKEDASLCAKFLELPLIHPEGIFSHFATADCADLHRAQEQADLFDLFCEMLENQGLHVPLRHLDNSAGLMNFSRHYEMVRAGIVIYGMYPSREVDPSLLTLEPALQWLSRVTHVKTLPSGRQIGYGGTFTTERQTVVATIPVGYADGYHRSLSGKFHVLIRGQKAPILGRICMDQMMVDVTGIPGVCVNDKVVLVGTYGQQAITMEQIAQAAGSFNYEFVSGISRRVPRIYTRGGKTIHTVHYLTDSFV